MFKCSNIASNYRQMKLIVNSRYIDIYQAFNILISKNRDLLVMRTHDNISHVAKLQLEIWA